MTLFSLSSVIVMRKIDSGALGESHAGDTLYSNIIIVYEEPFILLTIIPLIMYFFSLLLFEYL